MPLHRLRAAAHTPRLVAPIILAALLAACSSDTANHPAAAASSTSTAMPSAAGRAPPATAATKAAAATAVPNGTLTWKIVYRGNAVERGQHGGKVAIAHADTTIRYTVNGRVHLVAMRGQGALEVWTAGAPGQAATCHLTIDGSESLDWRGSVQINDRGEVPFSGRYHATGLVRHDCVRSEDIAVTLRADPNQHRYRLSLPGAQLTLHGQSTFTTDNAGFQPSVSFASDAQVKLPAVTVTKVSLPPAMQTLSGERVFHHVASVPARAGAVKLRPDRGASQPVSIDAGARPAISLDADVHWIFTPDRA